MQYLMLIYQNEASRAAMQPEDGKKEIAKYLAFNEWLGEKRNLGGNALQPTSTATTVRIRDGETVTTDGPFAETKEALGGYYLVEAKDLDEALDIASRIPAAKRGCIEVRPVWDY